MSSLVVKPRGTIAQTTLDGTTASAAAQWSHRPAQTVPPRGTPERKLLMGVPALVCC